MIFQTGKLVLAITFCALDSLATHSTLELTRVLSVSFCRGIALKHGHDNDDSELNGAPALSRFDSGQTRPNRPIGISHLGGVFSCTAA
jgi:hypothetical protein